MEGVLGDRVDGWLGQAFILNCRMDMAEPTNRDTVARFSDRAADYVKFRPTYPADAVRALLDGLGPPNRVVAADVGAGTGISARLLGDRGARVVAIEPSEDMRRAATPHPNVVWMSGRAEATGLRSRALDLVLCAQSFHWFQPAMVLPEFARILKAGRRLAIMWNRRSKTDPLTVGYGQAIVNVGGDVSVERFDFDPGIMTDGGLFSSVERLSFPHFQRLDLEGLIGRARSASYVPKSGAQGDWLLVLLRALHQKHADADGFVTLVYETEIFSANTPYFGAT